MSLMLTRSWTKSCGGAFFLLLVGMVCAAPPDDLAPQWQLPAAHEVALGGELGDAYRQGITRLSLEPYRSVEYLRSDLSFEVKRPFTNYSGDISGRFLEIACLTSPPGTLAPDTLPKLLRNISDYQLADGHFGRAIDWNLPLEPENPNAVILPVFWGHSRLLVGLLEAHRATGNEKLLECAKGVGDFYIVTADRLLDPNRTEEYRSTGSYAAGYVTDYFPAIEGLVRLYGVTRDKRYLHQAERMAEFFEHFDTLPIDHSHGNLITQHGLVLLYEATGKQEYLQRARDRWQQAWDGGYVWPTGGVGERFRVAWSTDEGCSEADWLRLSLDLWRITGDTRYLNAAERLLTNHYEMNRTANGGFGHHNFVCDETGPLLMQPQFTEAVWCCTFHGILGLHTLKSYVVVGSERGAYINFPFDVTAPVQTGPDVWRVTVSRTQEDSQAIVCRVGIDSTEISRCAAAGPLPQARLGRTGNGHEPARRVISSSRAEWLFASTCARGRSRRGRRHVGVRSAVGGSTPATGGRGYQRPDASPGRGVTPWALGVAGRGRRAAPGDRHCD